MRMIKECLKAVAITAIGIITCVICPEDATGGIFLLMISVPLLICRLSEICLAVIKAAKMTIEENNKIDKKSLAICKSV